MAGALLARAFADEPIHCYALPGVTAVERAERLAPYFVTAVRYGCRFGATWAVGAAPGELAGVGWWAPMPEAEFTDERIAAVNPTPFSPDLQAVLDRMMELELPLEYSEERAERYRGTSEEGRLFAVDIELHGLGYGATKDEEGNDDGPVIALEANGTAWVDWTAYRPGAPEHGEAEGVAVGIDAAVVSFERALDGSLAVTV